jgi:hypothetical protein
MRVHIFTPGPLSNKEHHEVLDAFAAGISSTTDNVVRCYSVDRYVPCDVAVVFGVGKKNVPVSYARGEIIRYHRAAGKPVLVLEKGYVHRDEYYAAGWNGLNGRADFCNFRMPPDRWDQLKRKIKYQYDSGHTVLVCGQVPHDASVQNVDIIDWCTSTVRKLREAVPYPIVFRPHPLARDLTPEIFGAIPSTKTLAEDIADARYVVTYNSNVGVDAILEGVPIYAEDEGSMVYKLASRDLLNPVMPISPLVWRWARDLAYTQWTKAEMREGLPWRHLTK